MFHNRLHRLERIGQLEQIIAAMPAYPIYRESESCYSIHIYGLRHAFASEAEADVAAARTRRLAARPRLRWRSLVSVYAPPIIWQGV